MNKFYRAFLLIALVVNNSNVKAYESSNYDKDLPINCVSASVFPLVELLILNLDEVLINNLIMLLNDEAIVKLDEGRYSFDTEDLLEGENVIKAAPRSEALNGISTLDMVHLMQGLIVEDLNPLMAISADIDRSGSVTTKDLFDMRSIIIGLKPIGDLGQSFLIEKDRDLTGLDMYAFTNDFEEYTFESNSLDGVSSIELELFQYGNLSDAVSDFHKSDAQEIDLSIKMEDRSLVLDEVFEVVVRLGHSDMGTLAGAGLKLLHPNLELLSISAEEDNTDLIYNDQNEASTTFSFLPNENKKGCDITLTFKSKKKGMLSDLMQLDSEYNNEQINGNLELFKMSIEFVPETEVVDAFKIYPNPVINKLIINRINEADDFKVSIYNALGQLILSEKTSESTIEIDRSQLGTSQVVIVHVAYDDQYLVRRIVTSD